MSDLDRIRWHCRRGMLEIDLVLARFTEQYLDKLDVEQLAAFEALLDEQDNALLDLVMGRAETSDPRIAGILELVRGA
jgi:antitoxin CptB